MFWMLCQRVFSWWKRIMFFLSRMRGKDERVVEQRSLVRKCDQNARLKWVTNRQNVSITTKRSTLHIMWHFRFIVCLFNFCVVCVWERTKRQTESLMMAGLPFPFPRRCLLSCFSSYVTICTRTVRSRIRQVYPKTSGQSFLVMCAISAQMAAGIAFPKWLCMFSVGNNPSIVVAAVTAVVRQEL